MTDSLTTHDQDIAHLGINVVSSLLLGASNVAMQCLVAPSRNDVDAAHRIGLSLDIGVNGFKNWQSMSSLRRYLWIVLIASTLPLHLLSAFISRLAGLA